MSPSAPLTSEQLKEIIEDKNNTDKGGREVQEQVEDGEEVLDPANTGSVLNTVLSAVNNEFEHECLDEAARLLNAHPIRQSTDDRVPGHKYSNPGLPGTKFLAHQVRAIWFIVRQWAWDTDMPGALVAEEMGLGMTFTSVAAAMLCKLVTEKVVMGLPLSILWGNTLEEWEILADNDFPGIVGQERECYPLQRLNSVPRRLLEIQTTPPHGHPALVSALEPILVVTMPRVAETFKTVIDEMTHGTDFELVNLLHAENANLTHEDLNTCIDELENRWNIHLVSEDTLTSRAKPSSNSQLSYCAWCFGIFDESHRYKTKNSVGWQITKYATIGFKLQVTATPGFHSLYDWCFKTMWLFSGAPDDPEDDAVMKKHGAEVLYSAVKSLMHAIRTENEEAQQDAVHQMIQIAKPSMIRRWSESKLANGKQLVRIPKENAHLIDLECTEDEQAKLKTLVERYTSRGALGAWRVHGWRLACFSLVLGDTEDRNDVSGQCYDEWPLDTWVDSPIFRWLRETFLPMLVNEPGEYPEPDQEDESTEALLPEQDQYENALPGAPPPQQAVLFCTLPGQVRHLKWWLTQFFADNVDIFHMYAEMGNDECTEMQLKFQDSRNPYVFITTPKVGGTGLNLTAANHAVMTQKFWVLNEQRQVFARVVRLAQNRVPHTWLLKTGAGGYDNRASDLHQLSGVTQMRVLHGLMSRLTIMTTMIYRNLESRKEHTNRLTENGDTLQSDEPSSEIVRTINQGTPL